MAKQSAVNLDVTVNATGYKIAGGSSTARGVTVAGTNDFTLTSQASTANMTLPDAAASTLLGTDSLAAKGDLLSASAASTLEVLTVGTDGQYLQADSGETSGLRWASAAAVEWNEITGTSSAMAVNNGYIANNGALVTLTLPSTAALGTRIRVAGLGAGGWKVAQNASQTIHFGSLDTTTGVGGSVASSNRYDALEMLCVAANTDWVVLSSQGNQTIV